MSPEPSDVRRDYDPLERLISYQRSIRQYSRPTRPQTPWVQQRLAACRRGLEYWEAKIDAMAAEFDPKCGAMTQGSYPLTGKHWTLEEEAALYRELIELALEKQLEAFMANEQDLYFAIGRAQQDLVMQLAIVTREILRGQTDTPQG